MKRIETVYWPGGCERAVTLSFDDGRTEDYRLVEMFNKYGLKATFHLCIPELLQKIIGDATLVDAADYAALYRGHEISCHMAHHPFPAWMPGAWNVLPLRQLFRAGGSGLPQRGNGILAYR